MWQPSVRMAQANKIHKWASPQQSAESFLLLAHLSGHYVAELLLDLLLGLGIEVG